MTITTLSSEEKRCLRLWFRQAIAELDKIEASQRLLRWHVPANASTRTHRQKISRRIRARGTVSTHKGELIGA